MRAAYSLAEKIAIETLASGILRGKSEHEIQERIKLFLEVDVSITHGRPIYFEQAAAALGTDAVQPIDNRSKFGKDVWELYVRSSHVVERQYSKLIESTRNSFAPPRPALSKYEQ